MIFGVPKESLRHEHRVGMTPYAVSVLAQSGHQIYIERDAGRDSHFTNEDYQQAGATIVHSSDEVFGRADVVCRVGMMQAADIAMLPRGATVCGFLHLAVANHDVIDKFAEREITAIGYEIVERDGSRPVLRALSEIAGQMVVHKGASLMEFEAGGRGIVLGAAPGIPPATVVILGAGTLGGVAARRAVACGAHVIVLDSDVEKLRAVAGGCPNSAIVTLLASRRNIARSTAIADMLIGAVNLPGGRTPSLVTEPMVRAMKQGAVILDLSIDEGGCVATSRPTTPDNPTFQVHGVTHFCVPNMTAAVPRAASRALTLAAIPYLSHFAAEGVEAAIAGDAGLARGVYMYRGKVVHPLAAEALGIEAADLASLVRR